MQQEEHRQTVQSEYWKVIIQMLREYVETLDAVLKASVNYGDTRYVSNNEWWGTLS